MRCQSASHSGGDLLPDKIKSSFRGASEASEPGIHNPRREYGFPDAQLPI
jgi:hypothetical protein